MRQTVRIKGLPGADTTFAGGALRTLSVACSHPDIIAGAGSSGLIGGAERDEVGRPHSLDGWAVNHGRSLGRSQGASLGTVNETLFPPLRNRSTSNTSAAVPPR